MYIAITLNHFRAVKQWADTHGGQASLDVSSFELEVKARNRYFKLFPQFNARINGRLCHVPTLTQDTSGFIGWLPYRPIKWALASDKLVFKRCLLQEGLTTPAMWESAADANDDFLLKRSVGSFGYDLAGPFKLAQEDNQHKLETFINAGGQGSVFAERFVAGRNLKVWFWGETAFHAQLHDYPMITGDGQTKVKTLVEARLREVNLHWASYPEQAVILQALNYQGVALDHILPAHQQLWLDYRYGRHFTPEATTEKADNALPNFTADLRAQIDQIGSILNRYLFEEFTVPVLYSLDGVLDQHGKIGWLEMNSNPIFPPTGYPHMLSSLLGTPVDSQMNPQMDSHMHSHMDAALPINHEMMESL